MGSSSGPAVSPLAPSSFPVMPDVAGVRTATAHSGMKYQGRDDVLLVSLDPGAAAAGVFTRSLAPSAPVDWCRKTLKGGDGGARGLIVNAGNANAFTGRQGEEAVVATVEAVADGLGCRPSHVFAASTGVIGEDLPYNRITGVLGPAIAALSLGNWEAAAKAIMTTDTFAKGAGRSIQIGSHTVNLAGIAKGSGMIAPDMATMLSFVFTDARIPAEVLQTLLDDAVSKSFNAITVDSDTSTSDTLMVFATGAGSEHLPVTSIDDEHLQDFRLALLAVCQDLAHQVVRDGEGASKFISVSVCGAEDDEAARRIGLSIANSPLVKTAIAGEDANWGRIVMAVGKAGERADRDALKITIGGIAVAEAGRAVEGFDETPVGEHMKGEDITIVVDVGVGQGEATVWTCDLTHGYIEINADYRS